MTDNYICCQCGKVIDGIGYTKYMGYGKPRIILCQEDGLREKHRLTMALKDIVLGL